MKKQILLPFVIIAGFSLVGLAQTPESRPPDKGPQPTVKELKEAAKQADRERKQQEKERKRQDKEQAIWDAEEQERRAREEPITKYDRFSDMTIVSAPYIKLFNPVFNVREYVNGAEFVRNELAMVGFVVFKGNQTTVASSAGLVFTTLGFDVFFGRDHELMFIADDVRIPLGPTLYRLEFPGQRSRRETMTVEIPIDTFAQIWQAEKVEFRLGNQDFFVREDGRKVLRRISELGAQRSTRSSGTLPEVTPRDSLFLGNWTLLVENVPRPFTLTIQQGPQGLIGSLRPPNGISIPLVSAETSASQSDFSLHGSGINEGKTVALRVVGNAQAETIKGLIVASPANGEKSITAPFTGFRVRQ